MTPNDSANEIYFTYLNGPDIDRLAMTDDEILAAVEIGLKAQGEGKTVIEPRVHLEPDPAFRGHFNVLRGYIGKAAGFSLGGLAGVKIVGDYVDNYKRGLPSEMALLNLFDPETGMPRSEEHTSELHSLMRISYAVFCLQKKNKSRQ